jgi:hypothetical protein
MPPTQLKPRRGFGLRVATPKPKNLESRESFSKDCKEMPLIVLIVPHLDKKVLQETRKYRQRQNGRGRDKQRLKVGGLTASFNPLKLKKLVRRLRLLASLIVSFNPLKRNGLGSSRRVKRG